MRPILKPHSPTLAGFPFSIDAFGTQYNPLLSLSSSNSTQTDNIMANSPPSTLNRIYSAILPQEWHIRPCNQLGTKLQYLIDLLSKTHQYRPRLQFPKVTLRVQIHEYIGKFFLDPHVEHESSFFVLTRPLLLQLSNWDPIRSHPYFVKQVILTNL